MTAVAAAIAAWLKSWGYQLGFWLLLLVALHQTGSRWQTEDALTQAKGYIADLSQRALEHQTTELQRTRDAQQAEADARERERQLARAHADTVDQTRDEIQRLSADRARLLGRLRSAESRVVSLAKVAQLPAAGTDRADRHSGAGGAAGDDAPSELPATLGIEDVLEAERADTIRVSLQACYQQYGLVRHSAGQINLAR